MYPAERVYTYVLQKSMPAKILQVILYISNNRGSVDGIVRELTSRNDFMNTFCEIRVEGLGDTG